MWIRFCSGALTILQLQQRSGCDVDSNLSTTENMFTAKYFSKEDTPFLVAQCLPNLAFTIRQHVNLFIDISTKTLDVWI